MRILPRVVPVETPWPRLEPICRPSPPPANSRRALIPRGLRLHDGTSQDRRCASSFPEQGADRRRVEGVDPGGFRGAGALWSLGCAQEPAIPNDLALDLAGPEGAVARSARAHGARSCCAEPSAAAAGDSTSPSGRSEDRAGSYSTGIGLFGS